MPLLGLWVSLLAVALLFYLTGAFLLVRRGAKTGAVCTGLLGVALGLASIDSLNAIRTLPPGTGGDVLRRWETPYGWIDVVGIPERGILALRENLHYVHGDTAQSVEREFRQGHLALLLHDRPQDVLFLGLGTGLTAGTALRHPAVECVTVVELIPAVVEAARMFSDVNDNVLDNPRTEIVIDDARHYLLGAGPMFDVIVSDLFVPWHSQTGYLYTVEHYRVARDRLRPGGIFCQWLAFNQIGAREFEIIADSMASVFPVTTVWWGRIAPNQGMVMLAGSEKPLELHGERIAERLAQLNAGAQRRDAYLRSTTYFYRLFIGRWDVCHPDRLNTDEHPRIEFLTPITYRNEGLLTGKALLEYFQNVLSRLSGEGVTFTPAPGRPLETQAHKHVLQYRVLMRQLRPEAGP